MKTISLAVSAGNFIFAQEKRVALNLASPRKRPQ
jgi:hypothetical protein